MSPPPIIIVRPCQFLKHKDIKVRFPAIKVKFLKSFFLTHSLLLSDQLCFLGVRL